LKNLRELQAVVSQLIAGPGPLNGDGEHRQLFDNVELFVRGGRSLRPTEKINIYANAYFYRLLECLKGEFPATLAVVGSQEFAELVRGYLLWRPPTEPSIFYAGRYLADFIRNHSLAERWPFIAELARLERATLETFHAQDALTLTDEAMQAIPPLQWPTIELQTHPGVEMLHNEWRVSEVLSAVESGDDWVEPTHETTMLIVWRQGTQVRYRDLEDEETRALDILRKGASFAVICEAIAAVADASDPVALIGRLLARWLVDGIIVRANAKLAESAAAP
jgi:hypothetical protein